MQGSTFAGIAMCLVYKQLHNKIMEILKTQYKLQIYESNDVQDINLNTLNTSSNNNLNQYFISYIDAQYYDDNLSLRKIEDQLLFYELLIVHGPEYGLIVNKNKSEDDGD